MIAIKITGGLSKIDQHRRVGCQDAARDEDLKHRGGSAVRVLKIPGTLYGRIAKGQGILV